MKKIFAILLLGFYLSVGAVNAISMHFCHGDLVGFSFNQIAESYCDDESTAKCCNDIYLEVDFDTEHLVSVTKVIEEPVQLHIFILDTDYSLIGDELNKVASYEICDPPGKELTDIILLTSSFLFYS